MKRSNLLLLLVPFIATLLVWQGVLRADVISFVNGDRLTGSVVSENPSRILFQSEVLGEISVDRKQVDSVSTDLPPLILEDEEGMVKWTREFAGSFSRSRGNTAKSELSGELFLNRNRVKRNEHTFKWKSYYSENNRKMNARRHYGLARAAYSFGKEKRFYEFNKIEADQDRFANIDYRLIPAVGIGLWLFDKESLKALFEIAGGFSHTKFREGTDSETEMVLVPRFFGETSLYDKFTLSEEFIAYPSVTEYPNYRWKSETLLEMPLLDSLSARLGLIDEYNSAPGKNSKRNDLRIETSLKYSF